jgi:tryptophan-rich sensory protein
MSYLRFALFTVPLILLLGIVSGRVAGSGDDNAWFAALIKPELMPPGAAFAIIWPVLYILLGLSLAIVLNARGARGRGLAVALFIVQMLLNFAWSPVFFGMHQVRTALFIILAMLVLNVVVAVLFMRIRPVAAYLLIPYIAWLGFASILNYQIVQLNPDAETLVPSQGGADIIL